MTVGSGSVTAPQTDRRTDPLTVRTISPEEHLAFLAGRRSASFLQVPGWGEVKNEWRRESIGWFRDAHSVRSSTTGETLAPQPPVGRR